MMHLGVWAVGREQSGIVGRFRGHVVCFLFLQLQWSCSLCGSLYLQVLYSSGFYWVLLGTARDRDCFFFDTSAKTDTIDDIEESGFVIGNAVFSSSN